MAADFDADVRLTPDDREALLLMAAQMAGNQPAARRLLRPLGYPVQAMPAWVPGITAEEWWDQVFAEFDLGIVVTPYRGLIVNLARRYPANAVLRQLHERYLRPRPVPVPAAQAPTPPAESGNGSIFVSYSRRDRDYVTALVKFLREAGLDVWVDAEIEVGERWVSVVRNQIDSCSAFLIVMSPDAEESQWVARELHRAEQKGKPVVPLLLRGKVFFHLANLHYTKATDGALPGADFIDRLRSLGAR